MLRSTLQIGVAAMVFSSPSYLAAQVTAIPVAPLRVTLIMKPSLSGGARVQVLRRASAAPSNIVMLDTAATAAHLAAGLQLMSGLRLQYGDEVAQDIVATPGTVQLPPDWPGSEYETWIHAQLERLRSAPYQVFKGVDTVRAVQVRLSPPRGRLVRKG